MQPLDDLLVVDLTRVLAGPFCTQMLADLGARVIKIESPNAGDETRGYGPPFLNGESAYFLCVNRNKQSLTLNLKDERGKAILWRLLERADALVENFRPDVLDRLGFGYEAVHAMHPRLIYCSISGFGQTGPYRDRPAFDLILQGMGGMMAITGEEGRPPVKVGVGIADICAGMYAAYAVLVALHARSRKGQGQWIDVAMLDGQVSWLTFMGAIYLATGQNPPRMGSDHPTIVPYKAFRTADGWITIGVGNDTIWWRFCEALNLDIADDPRFATNRDRVTHRDQLLSLLEAMFRERSTREWLAILDRAGVPCGPILTLAEIFADPHVRSREMVVELDHPRAGRITITGVPVKMSANPGAVTSSPPLLGQHTGAILSELGLSPAEIERLRHEGVV